jgi:hypothetical protein
MPETVLSRAGRVLRLAQQRPSKSIYSRDRRSPDVQDRAAAITATKARSAAELKQLGFLGASKADRERQARDLAKRIQKANPVQAKPVSQKEAFYMAAAKPQTIAGYDPLNIPGVRYAAGQTREVADALTQSIPGTFGLARDLLADVHSGKVSPLGLPSPGSKTERNLKEMTRSNLALLKEPWKHPALIALMFGRPLTASAATVASRGLAAARAAEAGTPALRALLTKPKPGEAFGEPRTFRSGGIETPGNYSKAADMEAFQRAVDIVRKRHPKLGLSSGPVVTRNLPARVGWELSQNRKITDAVSSAEALGLAAKTKLSKFPRKRHGQQVAQTAARVEFEGATVAERIALHEQVMATAKSPVKRARLARKIGLLQQAQKLLEATPGGPQVKLSNAALRELMAKAEKVAATRTESLLARGAISPEQAASRVQGPGRIVKGARFLYPKDAKARLREIDSQINALGKSRMTGVQRLSDVRTGTRSTRAAERGLSKANIKAKRLLIAPATAATAREAATANRAAAKASALRAKTAALAQRGEKLKPLYEREQRLAQIAYEGFQAGQVGEGVLARSQARFGRIRKEYEKTASALIAHRDAQLQGLQALEQQIASEAKIAADKAGNRAQAAAIRVAAEQRLRETVREQQQILLDQKKALESLSESENLVRELRGRVAASSGRLVGAEGYSAGKVRVPYTARYERTPLGRMSLGAGKVIGQPRELGTVTHAFKGERLLSGNFRDDALRLIAEDALAETRQTGKLAFRDQLLKAATPERLNEHQIAMRVGKLKDPAATQKMRDLLARPEDVLPSARMRAATEGDPFKQVRELIFPTELHGIPVAEIPAGSSIPGIKWVDERYLEGANLPPIATGAAGRPGLKQLAWTGHSINNATRLSYFYLALKYGTPNILGQIALNFIQAGAKVPLAWKRAATIHRDFGARDVGVVREAMGTGIGRSLLGSQRGALGFTSSKLAAAWSVILDVPFRDTAWVAEAYRAGHKTVEQQKALIDAAVSGDASQLADFIRITRRARNEILDYERLGHAEQALKQLFFIYPFTKASTVYVGHFLAEHPYKASVAATTAEKGSSDQQKIIGDVPGFQRGNIWFKDAKGNVRTSNPAAFSPIGPGVDVLRSAASLVAGGGNVNDLPAQYIHPMFRAALNAAFGADPTTGRKLDQSRSAFANFLDEMIRNTPQFALAQGLSGAKQGRTDVIFPTSPREAIKQYAIGGIVPRKVNPGAVHARAAREAPPLPKSGVRGGASGSKSIYAGQGSGSKSIYAK